MKERQRLLALLEGYDNAIQELYVLDDRGLLDLILRLERRRREAAAMLAEIDAEAESEVFKESRQEIAPRSSRAAA